MIYEFLTDYKDGLFSSLQGFILLHKLDRLSEDQQVNETRRKLSDYINKITVLENRRKHSVDLASITKTQKETQQKVSAVYRVLLCAFLNILLVITIMTLSFIIEWLNFFSNYLKFIGSILFVIPTFIVLRCLSTLWFADVANAALRYRGLSSGKLVIFSRAASDFLHAIIVELVFLGQAMAIYSINITIISPLLGFISMSLLNSLYSFDYIWMACGFSMTNRLSFIEHRWPYHLGFGTFLTIATSLSSSFVINGLIFGALFPFFIVSSFLANSSKATSSNNNVKIPPMPFYSFALFLTNKISLALFGKYC